MSTRPPRILPPSKDLRRTLPLSLTVVKFSSEGLTVGVRRYMAHRGYPSVFSGCWSLAEDEWRYPQAPRVPHVAQDACSSVFDVLQFCSRSTSAGSIFSLQGSTSSNTLLSALLMTGINMEHVHTSQQQYPTLLLE